jgi:NAD(P)H-dependent flavin oxidoreductase YrpB (nitropropane dioxygenase family)/3-hydroxymyristoyl/3-hydroxydecanoyl-(acyl carrier protein) dehydratase
MELTKEEIKKIIPYDEPFLWVDEVESIKDNTIVGYKQTSSEDPYFKGHFVDFPIMPGVLIVEGIAQTGTILLRKKMGENHKKNLLLAYQVRSAQFYKPVFPGDKIKYQVELLGFYGFKTANFKGEAFVVKENKSSSSPFAAARVVEERVGEEDKSSSSPFAAARVCEVRFSVAVIDKDEFKTKYLGEKEGKPLSQTKLPPLKIGNLFAKIPIIQGGMAVRVSLHNLAGNVAKEGAVGIIAVSGMNDPSEVKSEIRQAREIAGPQGVIGINIMGVAAHFLSLVKAAMEEKVNLIIQGAGFREDIFELGRKYSVPIFSMASSLKVAKKGEAMGASAIVIEGADAGGHLGFPKGHPFRKTIDIVKEVAGVVKIPLIAAGGIFDGRDIVEMLRAGAKGVQMATRFVATKECDVHQNFKEVHLKAKKEDIVIIHSPVGLPGRAIKTPLVEKILAGKAPKPDPKKCQGCIGMVCDKSYCILDALENARKGDIENGLVFAGSNVWRVKKIVSVKELIQELVREANAILKQEPLVVKEIYV